VIAMSGEIECIRKLLEDHGIAHTHQREEILSLFIMESKHYKPDEIFKLLRCKGIGIATVYRTLEMLRKCNVIKEISIGKERFYELKKNESKSVYVHFKCDICGKFFDYYDIETVRSYDQALVAIEKKMDVLIKDVNITVNGICSKCKQ